MTKPIASTTVEIRGKNDHLKKTVQETKQEVNSLGTETERASKKIGGGFDEATKKASRLQTVLTRIFMPVAFVAAAIRAARAIDDITSSSEKLRASFRGAMGDAQNRVDQFRRAGLSNLQKDMADLADEERRVRQELEELFKASRDPFTVSGIARTIFGDTKELEDAQRQVSSIFNELRSRQRDLNRERQRDEEVDVARTAVRIQGEAARMMAERLEKEGRFKEAVELRASAERDAHAATIADLEKQRQAFEEAYGPESFRFDAVRRALDQIHQIRLKQIDDEAAYMGRRMREEVERELQRALDSVTDSFGFNFTDAADTIAAAIDRNAARRGR